MNMNTYTRSDDACGVTGLQIKCHCELLKGAKQSHRIEFFPLMT